MKRIICSLCVMACVLAAGPALAGYDQNIGVDYQADVDANGGTATNNPFGPNGEWEFQFPEGTTGTVVGGIPWSGQPGWCAGDGSSCETGGGGYFYNDGWGLPGGGPLASAGKQLVVGHGPHHYTWTAPASVTEGSVTLSGNLLQMFESARQLDLVARRGNWEKVIATSVSPPDAIFAEAVAFSTVLTNVSPGDVVNFHVEPSASGGNGVNTFAQVELSVAGGGVPEPTSFVLLAMSAMAGLLGFRRR